MSDRYTRRPSDGEWVCATCGSLVGNPLAHGLFHVRFNLMYDAIPVSMTGESITATDWQAAHDAGEDEELFPGAARTCALCGHRGRLLGGSATEPGRPTVHLCHDCGDDDHECYHRWTVYGVRPHTDDCRDLYCGGCQRVDVDVPHVDPCDCDDCRTIVMHNYDSEPDLPNEEEPRKCAVCGEPIKWSEPRGMYVHDDPVTQYESAGDHDPTLTPPEPPVGAGWFHDGVLWWRDSNGPITKESCWIARIDGAFTFKAWADLQPGSPAIPASIPGKGEW